jgi:hypothetical protein
LEALLSIGRLLCIGSVSRFAALFRELETQLTGYTVNKEVVPVRWRILMVPQ